MYRVNLTVLKPYLWKYTRTRLSHLAKIESIKYEYIRLYKEILRCKFSVMDVINHEKYHNKGVSCYYYIK